ncbi:MAG TPA: hypothetical protein VI749_00140 [Candidatus Omnitrophota bacterium]|nr:hypothetical protein [Candidatus Omnitrophota bacterium]
MDLAKIMGKCSTLTVFEQRSSTANYNELVFSYRDLQAWQKILEQELGPAVKPAGEKPSPEDQKIAESFGGIYANQMLFRKDTSEGTVIAMFWPWSDEEHVTLKLALCK